MSLDVRIKQDIKDLKEAIKHCNDKIAECSENGMVGCGLQHLQLRDWLVELLTIKELISKDKGE